MTHYWVGVASRDHVLAAVRGGFCQLNHGKEGPLKRLAPVDRILYYSPRTEMRAGQPLRAFTAVGRILDDEPYQVAQTEGFKPYRRKVHYFEAHDAEIKPLLEKLLVTRGNSGWGHILRRGMFEIEHHDYDLIAKTMGVSGNDLIPHHSSDRVESSRHFYDG